MVSCNAIDGDKLARFEVGSEICSLRLGIFILDRGYLWDDPVVVWFIRFVRGRLDSSLT
jgi:hypothetical protein